MKFKRISEKQIQCLISQEELVEKGIAIDDFLDHRDKTEEFLREVVDEAQDALDIEEMGHFFSVQMHILKTGNISLIINLEGDDGHGESLADVEQASSVLDKIRDKHGDDFIDDTSSGSIKDFIEHLIQSAGFGDNEEADTDGHTSNVERPLSNEELDSIMGSDGFTDAFGELCNNLKKMFAEDDATDSVVEQKANHSTKHDANENPDEILGGSPVFVRMETLDDCIRMSKALKDVKCNYSKLYKYDEEYYIEIAFINDSKFVAGQIMTISEYAEEIFTFDEGGALIEEHGKPIIAEDAVAVLAKL